jgi:hypothetical protein
MNDFVYELVIMVKTYVKKGTVEVKYHLVFGILLY